MAKKENRIIVSGSIAEDMIFVVPGLLADHLRFQSERNISVSILSDEHQRHRGGTGANIAYTLALLGEKPILLGAIGKKDEAYLKQLAKIGVDVTQVLRSDLETSAFTVLTDVENNQVAAFSAGAMGDPENFMRSADLLARTSAFVMISPNDPELMEAQISLCKNYGLRMCFDVGQQVINGSVELLRAGVESCEVLIANDYEMVRIAERLEISLEDLIASVPVCITTLGGDGSRIEGSQVPDQLEIPIANARDVVDPTGAGDAYRAGFFYGYLRGWDYETCGKLGSTAASFAIEQFGGQEHIFTRDEFAQRYEESFGEGLSL